MQEIADTPEFAALAELQREPVVDILDECDAYLETHVQLIYAWGDQQPLPEGVLRAEVVAELLRVLARDDRVAALLADRNVAEVLLPQGRLGGAPGVRLVRGACG